MPPEHSEHADYAAMPTGFLEAIVHDLADPQFLRRQWDRLMTQEPEIADRLLGFANVYTTTAPSENPVFSKKSVIHLLLSYHYLPHALTEVRQLETTFGRNRDTPVPVRAESSEVISPLYAASDETGLPKVKHNTADQAVLQHVVDEITAWAEAQNTETISLKGLRIVLRNFLEDADVEIKRGDAGRGDGLQQP